jgi:hypothetical protein
VALAWLTLQVSGSGLVLGTALMAAAVPRAGFLISVAGLGLAFTFDAVTFLVSMLALWAIRSADGPFHRPERPLRVGGKGLFSSITAGFRSVWNDPPTRTLLIMISAIEFSTARPFLVGLAALAQTRFAGGAVTYGILLSAWGGGALLGTLAAGSTPIPLNRGTVLRIGAGGVGVGLILFGLAPAVWVAAGLLAFMGMASGYIQVVIISWLQARTEDGMLGRVMSIAMLSSVGLPRSPTDSPACSWNSIRRFYSDWRVDWFWLRRLPR